MRRFVRRLAGLAARGVDVLGRCAWTVAWVAWMRVHAACVPGAECAFGAMHAWPACQCSANTHRYGNEGAGAAPRGAGALPSVPHAHARPGFPPVSTFVGSKGTHQASLLYMYLGSLLWQSFALRELSSFLILVDCLPGLLQNLDQPREMCWTEPAFRVRGG